VRALRAVLSVITIFSVLSLQAKYACTGYANVGEACSMVFCNEFLWT
jgi:hypothetical protein